MAEYYAGMDLGARSSWLCVVDAKGVKRLNRRIANDPSQQYEEARDKLEQYRALPGQ